MNRDPDLLEARVEGYDFRDLIPGVMFGTASDRYAGWIGQIYTADWEKNVSSRKRTLGGQQFEERTVPVASVEEYFQHFDVLEIDFTFYRALTSPDGSATNNYFVLQRYSESSPSNARFLLKAPQQVTARVLRRGGGGKPQYVENPDFLDADIFLKHFIEPGIAVLGDCFAGVIFEQEYQRKSSGPSDEENVAAFDRFFSEIQERADSRIPQIHIELRSGHLLTPPYFDWLEHAGIGHVFSHWTWLPPLAKQWALSGERFTAQDKTMACRLLTPRNVPYAKAYEMAHPFDREVAEISDTPQAQAMVDDAASLSVESLKKGVVPMIISNNRAWGNAPSLAQKVARRVLEELDDDH